MLKPNRITSVFGFVGTNTLLLLSLFCATTLSAQDRSSESESAQWRTAEQNLSNSRSQRAEHSLDPANVNRLATKWAFTTGGDVSATPTVGDNAVYFPDWGG